MQPGRDSAGTRAQACDRRLQRLTGGAPGRPGAGPRLPPPPRGRWVPGPPAWDVASTHVQTLAPCPLLSAGPGRPSVRNPLREPETHTEV